MIITVHIHYPQLPPDWQSLPVTQWPALYRVGDGKWQQGATESIEPRENPSVYVYLPALSIYSDQVDIPRKQQRHLTRILPFTIEERLAEELDAMHIVPGPIRAETVSVRAIPHRLIRTLCNGLNDLELPPTGLFSEQDLLLADAGEAILWLDNQHSRLSLEAKSLTLPATQRRHMFSLLQTELEKRKSLQLTVYFCEEDIDSETQLLLQDLRDQDAVSVAEKPLPKDTNSLLSTLDRLGMPLGDKLESATNLLTGPYLPAKVPAGQFNWRPIAWAAGILLILNIAYLWGSGWYFQQQADKLQAQNESVYRNYFPADKRIINIRTQTRNHLRGATPADEGFVRLLNRFVGQWKPLRNQLTLKSLRYNQQRGQMLLDLEGGSIAQLDQLQKSLGSDAELLSANEDTKGVRGRLQIKGGRP
ncbi:hypothetical protein HBA55_33095 [Pseudomaricurvus alkylphenolicus]|uniref:type II secretion system protein GspL n=1 Tax=Pseudomaricurvus alkylphenolicus TaxID=1306991 RepID=UPI001422F386|nr:type II secretion system protein GspL [Pseudomaricurvus alkylphenolicus]NIB44471.1 hypothetical protein [Pseudomaricurvus alkylphenolicus]